MASGNIRSPLPGYIIKRIYVVTCTICNEEVNRSMSGDEPETPEEARESILDHDKVFHGPG